MQRQPDTYQFSPVDWDESNVYDYDDWAMDQACERYDYLSGVAADLEGMLDDQQCDYLSDLDLTSEDYHALDAIRNQTSEIHA